MNSIFEFFFCPVHGVFAPANWPILMGIYASCGGVVREQLLAFFKRFR